MMTGGYMTAGLFLCPSAVEMRKNGSFQLCKMTI